MFDNLPENLKRRVQDFLLANDFPAAKEVHDNWMALQPGVYASHEEKLCILIDS